MVLPLLIALSANVETVVNNQVSGENSSVHTEITNTVNGKTTKVVSDKQGEIKVQVKNGEEANITQTNVSKTPINSPSVTKKEVVKSVKTTNVKTAEKKGFFIFLNSFVKRFFNVFRFNY